MTTSTGDPADSTTGPARYRPRITEVTARQWTGDNEAAMTEFTGPDRFDHYPGYLDTAEPVATSVLSSKHSNWLELELGDWVVRDGEGNLSRCKADDFATDYEPATDAADFERQAADLAALRDIVTKTMPAITALWDYTLAQIMPAWRAIEPLLTADAEPTVGRLNDGADVPLTLGNGAPVVGTATVAADGTVTATVTDPGVAAILSGALSEYSLGASRGETSTWRQL